ncbi:DUF4097 family beta strand repeat-containing protein [Amycolatopsis suaedae]|uniref:DUF4097 domain-containing protein n=1 Tax=Amycolatopsis suaedae TaxID=2510978 RepID=A0A4Q7JBH4_9PSEU|nr:DUF4097 family beta strand repeat-containing protein [Amycolatopsis suaedae]RZQ65180.1 hypothetical protein EWH70_04630 [Amycolatopsis suaedae]
MARPALAVGGVVLIAAGVALGLGWWWPSDEERTGEVDAVKTVRIDNDSGTVSVRAADVQRTTVVQKIDYRWGSPSDSYRVNGGELVLADCGWWCSVDYEVVVPRGTTVTGENDSGDVSLDGVASVDVSVDSGNLDVRNIAGPVKADASSGDVTLSGIGGDLEAKANSGAISGDGLRGRVNAEADSGDISLTLANPQNVRAHADSGNVEVAVPAGSYRVIGDSDSGERQIGIATAPNAQFELDLGTDSGDVLVRTA